jgi:hypothetical protein
MRARVTEVRQAARDQAVDDPNLVYEKQPECEAQKARGEPQVALDPRDCRDA